MPPHAVSQGIFSRFETGFSGGGDSHLGMISLQTLVALDDRRIFSIPTCAVKASNRCRDQGLDEGARSGGGDGISSLGSK